MRLSDALKDPKAHSRLVFLVAATIGSLESFLEYLPKKARREIPPDILEKLTTVKNTWLLFSEESQTSYEKKEFAPYSLDSLCTYCGLLHKDGEIKCVGGIEELNKLYAGK